MPALEGLRGHECVVMRGRMRLARHSTKRNHPLESVFEYYSTRRTSESLSALPRPPSTLFLLAAGGGLDQLEGGATTPSGVERWRLSNADGV